MSLEIKVLVFWAVTTFGLWLATVVQYTLSDSNLRWKYFRDDYSTFGALYYVCMRVGGIAIPIYLFVKAAIWWFKL